MNNLVQDFNRFAGMLERREPFALGRFADGELAILENCPISTAEFRHDRNEPDSRGMLYEALTYRAPNYYVGISCPCCDRAAFEALFRMARHDKSGITFSNLWVNANHQRARDLLLRMIDPSWSNGVGAMLVCSEKAKSVCSGQFRVPAGEALRRPLKAEQVEEIARESVARQRPVLVAAGPVSAWLVMRLHMVEPSGTYLDIGSVLDPELGLGQTRGYHRGEGGAGKVCSWK